MNIFTHPAEKEAVIHWKNYQMNCQYGSIAATEKNP